MQKGKPFEFWCQPASMGQQPSLPEVLSTVSGKDLCSIFGAVDPTWLEVCRVHLFSPVFTRIGM